MALYRVMIGTREYRVEIAEGHLAVNGQQEQGLLLPLNEIGLYLLRWGEKAREMQLRLQTPGTVEVLSGVRRVIAQVMKDSGQIGLKKQLPWEGDLTAPMPGLIIDVLAQLGDRVEKNQTLVIMESMKMQMELRAPITGSISKINVSLKEYVEKDKLLFRIEPEERTP